MSEKDDELADEDLLNSRVVATTAVELQIPNKMLRLVEEIAEKKQITVPTLMTRWLMQQLRQERKKLKRIAEWW